MSTDLHHRTVTRPEKQPHRAPNTYPTRNDIYWVITTGTDLCSVMVEQADYLSENDLCRWASSMHIDFDWHDDLPEQPTVILSTSIEAPG